MKKLLLATLTLLATWLGTPIASCADLADGERAALVALAARSDRLWDEGDAAALAALYADDADLRLGERVAVSSREDIAAYFTTSFARREPGLHHLTEVVAVRELAPGLVMVDANVRLERETADGGRELLRRFLNHTLLRKDGDGWRFAAVRAHPLPAG